jgi:3-hydroxyisobutyrate dehydrogenase
MGVLDILTWCEESPREEPMVSRVGLIGLGIMGMPMALNLIKAGFQLVVHNRTRAREAEAVQAGATPAASPREVAESSELVITMVPDSADVRQVILGPDGVIEAAREGLIVIDMSTVSPTVAREAASELQKKGTQMLDAPVSGGQSGAVQGTLAIMVGGDKEVLATCMPVFEAMGQRIVHVGPNGAGQTVKLVNQILVAGTLNAVCEALVFGAKAGLDLDAALEAVGGGAAASWQLENLGKRIVKGDFAPGFMVKLQQKDLKLILEQGREMHVALPGTALVNQLYQVLEAAGEGELGTQALAHAHERASGVEARTT